VTIEKHGRAVAVVISKEDFDDLEAMKSGRLRAEIQKGIDANNAGDVVEVVDRELEQFVDRIMTGGTEPTAR
jgi:PHD/YefM family antitoxin component YafN of YafNO toxin-antitoxin module